MAPCLPFTSCFSGWFARTTQIDSSSSGGNDGSTSRNSASKRFGVNGGRAGTSPNDGRKRIESPTVASSDARFRRMLLRKRGAKKTDSDDLPEPVDKLPEGTLLHWAPRSRCCEEVLEEIRLRVPANSRVSLDTVDAKVEHENGRRNLLTRIRELLFRERTPEELEIKELRKEKKAVIKYLKENNLYNRRMSYEHMKDLKAIAERSFGESRKGQDSQEIELKVMESASVPSTSSATPESVEVQKPEAAEDHQPEPTDVYKPESPIESDFVPKALLRPEGPLEETDGNQVHPGTGLPISAPINIPGIFRTWPMESLPVVKDNMLIRVLPGDIACIQCNPKAVVVQAVVSPEMDNDERPM